MKKSKHFRKDVIIARIIAAAALIILIALIVGAVSLFTKPSDSNKDSQNSKNTESVNHENVNTDEDLQNEDTEIQDVEIEDSESEAEDVVYVETTTQVKLRAEANTSCATLDRIDGGTRLEVLEILDGWYKVSYNGQIGYVSATYANIVE